MAEALDLFVVSQRPDAHIPNIFTDDGACQIQTLDSADEACMEVPAANS